MATFQKGPRNAETEIRQSITFNMPGWYCDTSGESIHTGEDMKVSDWMLNELKAGG